MIVLDEPVKFGDNPEITEIEITRPTWAQVTNAQRRLSTGATIANSNAVAEDLLVSNSGLNPKVVARLPYDVVSEASTYYQDFIQGGRKILKK